MFSNVFARISFVVLLSIVFCGVSLAQSAGDKSGKAGEKHARGLPRVTQIDIDGLRKLLVSSGKPLLINFWATWCDPCREEFPDLVKVETEFHGKVDFITVSLDDLADINTYVPQFLHGVKSTMPAYLLRTPDESAAISLVSPTWTGNLPMTVVFDAGGVISYQRNGKVHLDVLRENLRKLLPSESAK
jgi:thiol-disulfide isomerase/thioredoxin